MVGGPAFTEPQAVAGTVEAVAMTNASSPRAVVEITDGSGRFRMSLPPGRYQLSGRSPKFGDNRIPCNAQAEIAVFDDASVQADVFCQMR
jgi:hypothetical protein